MRRPARRAGARVAKRRPEPARSRGARRSREPTRSAARRVDALATPLGVALLAALFALLALALYAPALGGPFVSDDLHYVATNPYVHDPSPANVAAILDPWSPASVMVVNYAPVQMLVHALEWQLFAEHTTGYHVVNVLLHALGAALLVLVFARAGLAPAAAALGGLLFLVHPANVEAVAWVSQLKSPASFALSMTALLAHPRRPALATALFGLALLAKPTAAFALPVAALLDWSRDGRVRIGWLCAWAALLAAYGGVELWTHQRSGAAEPVAEDLAVRLRSSVAIAARYLWMAATSLGVSAFHEPAPSRGWSDPLWLAGALAVAALGARCAVALRRRSAEAAFWVWAAVSFLPVSQLFPFLYPMADRYLYFILPGLIGGALFVLRDASAHRATEPARRRLANAGLAVGLALAVVFAARSAARAEIWASPRALIADSAAHYPEGRTAHLLKAVRAAQLADADSAVAELRAARDLGFNRYEQLQSDPAFDGIRADPRFAALVREMAGWWVDRLSATADPTQIELRTLAAAHLARGERAAAIEALERALARGGPLDARLRDELAQLRAPPP